MLRSEVLGVPFAEQAGRIDDQYFPSAFLGFALSQHQDAGRQAGAVEEVRRQSNHGLDQIVL